MPLHCRRRRVVPGLAGRRTNLHAKTSQMMRSQRQFSLWRSPPHWAVRTCVSGNGLSKCGPNPTVGRSTDGPPLSWDRGLDRECRLCVGVGRRRSWGPAIRSREPSDRKISKLSLHRNLQTRDSSSIRGVDLRSGSRREEGGQTRKVRPLTEVCEAGALCSKQRPFAAGRVGRSRARSRARKSGAREAQRGPRVTLLAPSTTTDSVDPP